MINNKLVHLKNDLVKNKIYIIFILSLLVLSLTAPAFLNTYNLSIILGNTMLNGIVVIGFTVVLICGHLDLSTVSIMNLAGNIAIYTISKTDKIFLGILFAVLSGCIVGLINGLLVTKAKINSFISTLGVSTLIQGLVSFSNNAATRSVTNFSATDFLDKKVFSIFSYRAILVLFIVIVMHIFLSNTFMGKNFYLVGGNREAAWHAGLNTDKYFNIAFVINGIFAALGGSIYACYLGAAMADLGDKGINPLNTLIAAAVMGGASLSGGKGNIFHSYMGVLTLTALYNGMSCFKLGFEVQLFINGIVLMIIVLTGAISEYKKNKYAGAKLDLF